MKRTARKPSGASSWESTHKGRAEWFYERSSFPARDAAPLALERYWAEQGAFNRTPDHRWTCVGPNNIAGRVTCLAVHPEDENRIYAGAAGGGVWMSADRGETWLPSWPRFVSQNIGAITVTRWGREYSVFAATGEANLSADSYPGSGIYLASADGLLWESFIVPPDNRTTFDLERNIETIPRRIGGLVFNRKGRVAIASVTLDVRLPAGLFLDEGATGIQPVVDWGGHTLERNYQCHSVLIHPANDDILYAAIEPRGSLNGVWRSTDGGKTWEHLTRGMPPGEEFGRVSLTIAPSRPATLYALAADRRKRVLGIFRTEDGGDSWDEILHHRFPRERFMSYNNTIVVHPDDPDFVIWGGARLYRTRNGGKNWHAITDSGDQAARNYVHADHHALVMPKGDLVYSGNDGGVAVSEDGGDTWSDRSRGMTTTMFYDVEVAATDGSVFGGGCQDNGTLITGVAENKGLGGVPGEFRQVLGGDGAWMVIDPADAEHMFCSAQEFFIARHRRGEAWDKGSWRIVSPRGMPEGERKQRAIAVLAIQPGRRRGIKTVWAGSSRLWRTADDGRNWKPVSPPFDGSVISAIDVATVDSKVIFVGTTKGAIYRSRDGGRTWSGDIAGNDIPRRLITRIEVHPDNPETLAVAVSSTGAPGTVLRRTEGQDPSTLKLFSHVFLSQDCGATWTDIDAGVLPDVVFNVVTWETRPPFRLFAAGDAGVWVYSDGKWLNITGNMPNVVVSDLVYHEKDRTLTAATYGRAIWRITVPPVFGVVEPVEGGPTTMRAAGIQEDQSVAPPALLSPPDGSVFDHFPRKMEFSIGRVDGAIGYAVEIEDNVGSNAVTSKRTTLKWEFSGADDGRWRAWAILPESTRSRLSDWRQFRFTV